MNTFGHGEAISCISFQTLEKLHLRFFTYLKVNIYVIHPQANVVLKMLRHTVLEVKRHVFITFRHSFCGFRVSIPSGLYRLLQTKHVFWPWQSYKLYRFLWTEANLHLLFVILLIIVTIVLIIVAIIAAIKIKKIMNETNRTDASVKHQQAPVIYKMLLYT